MDDSNSNSGPSLSRRGLIRGATGVVVAGALLEAAAGSLGASAAPSSGGAAQLTLYDGQGKQLSTIDCESWSWGTSNPSTAGGMGNGKSTPALTITKEIDRASTILLEQEADQPTPKVAEALLTFTDAAGDACSIDVTQIQSVSNELLMAVKSQGVPEHSGHSCSIFGLVIVIKIGNVTITIDI